MKSFYDIYLEVIQEEIDKRVKNTKDRLNKRRGEYSDEKDNLKKRVLHNKNQIDQKKLKGYKLEKERDYLKDRSRQEKDRDNRGMW